MRARKRFTWGAASVGLLATLAACSDAGLAPPDELGPDNSGPSLQAWWERPDTVTTVFIVYPNRTYTYSIAGVHKITFPEGSICDPAASPYGPKFWDRPCDPVSRPVTITARSWTDSDGHPGVDFSPQLRFAPSSGRDDAVVLYMKDKAASGDPAFNILYCGLFEVCIDESLYDPSQKTRHDPQNGFLFRRIGHFSGYNVAA